MKKIEIIERITDANGSISENILTSWEHKNQFIPEIIRFGELKIYLQERIVKKNDNHVHFRCTSHTWISICTINAIPRKLIHSTTLNASI